MSTETPILLDSGYLPATATATMLNTKVNISALGNVFVEEQDGDLYLEKITAPGYDVWVKIDNGGLFDVNSVSGT